MESGAEITALAAATIAALARSGLKIATVESCTGGLIAAALTAVPGASDVLFGGFVTYANAAKSTMVGVEPRMIGDFGAVSAQVARAMANGGRRTARTDLSLAVTGVAGPGGGSARKPVGLVYIACATERDTSVEEYRFGDLGREAVRQASVVAALELALRVLAARESRREPF